MTLRKAAVYGVGAAGARRQVSRVGEYAGAGVSDAARARSPPGRHDRHGIPRRRSSLPGSKAALAHGSGAGAGRQSAQSVLARRCAARQRAGPCKPPSRRTPSSSRPASCVHADGDCRRRWYSTACADRRHRRRRGRSTWGRRTDDWRPLQGYENRRRCRRAGGSPDAWLSTDAAVGRDAVGSLDPGLIVGDLKRSAPTSEQPTLPVPPSAVESRRPPRPGHPRRQR